MPRDITDCLVYCSDCGCRLERNGICRICGHIDIPLLPGMVPDLASLSQQAATAILTGPECQLTLGNVTTANSATVAVDLIISSDPVTGTQLAIGDPVNVEVSLGP